MTTTGWTRVRLGDVAHQVIEHEHDPESAGLERYVGLEHLDPEHITVERWGDIADGTTFTKRFRAGQLLFAKRRAYQRKAAVADFDGICSGDLIVIEANPDALLPELLPHIVHTDRFLDHALRTSSGSLSPRTKWKDLAEYEFDLPPLDRQREIVDLLGLQDVAGSKAAHVLAAIRSLEQALIDGVFTEMESVGHVQRLGDVCEWTTGKAFPSADYADHGVKLLRPGNMGDDGHLVWPAKNTTCLPHSYLGSNGDLIVQADDVIMNLTAQSKDDGFLGRVCVADATDTSLLNQRLAILRFGKSVYPSFGALALRSSAFRRYIEPRGKGTTVTHIYWQDVAGFELPVPPLKEQIRVAAELANVDATRALLGRHQATYRQLRQALGGQVFRSAPT